MANQKTYNRHQALLGKRPSLLMALEPRILFDGVGAEVIADVSATAFLPQDSGTAPDAPDTVDTPVADTAPADATPIADASADVADAGTASDPASDPAQLTTPELSGQEQANASSPEATQSASTAPTADSSGAIGSTVSDTAATSVETDISPADASSLETSTVDTLNTDATASTSPDATTPTSPSLGTDPQADDTSTLLEIAPLDPADVLSSTPISQVVFVDTAVHDYQTLVDGVVNITDNDLADTNPTGSIGSSAYTVSGSTLVVTLGENPLDDISAALANYTDLSAIHLVSHGDTGEVRIGGLAISEQNLDQYSALFSSMGNSLNESGDILLYGCKVGADGVGQAFINAVAALTQADINASDNPTGNAASGGDWNLEVQHGQIEADTLAIADWLGVMGTTVSITPSNVVSTGQGFTVTAYNANGTEGMVGIQTGSPSGFGVAGALSGDTNEIGETTTGQRRAEMLEVTFDDPVASAQVWLAWLAADETAVIRLYNGSTLVGIRTINGGNDAISDPYTLTPTGGASSFNRIEFTVPTDNPNRNDDYLVHRVDFVRQRAPVDGNETISTPEDKPVSGNVLSNASDPDGDAVRVTQFVVNSTTYPVSSSTPGVAAIAGVGSITIASNGNYTFTPAADWNGSVPTITYTVSDTDGLTDTSTLSITVDAEVDIADDSASTTSGQPTIIDVLGNDNFEGTPVVTGVTQGANGTVVINSDRTVTYTANADFTGSDSFTYTVTSGGVTETATVTVMVGANPSDITGDTSGTGTEDGGQITGQITDGDLDGLDVATPYAVTSNGTNGTATIDASGNWTYTPNADYNGSDSFVVTVTDALGNTTTQTITVTVDAEVDIADDSASTTSGQPTIIDVLGNDNFEGTPVVTGVTQGANGTVVINSDRTVTYTANADFTGSDSFTYTVTSGGVTETATVTVMVGANPSDITGDTSGTGTEDGGQITGQITDGDLDGLDVATPYAVTSNGTNGTATIDASGNWTYTPNADYNGSDSFVVTVTDALGNTTTQTITVTVDAEVDIADDSASTTSGQPTIIDVLGNDNFEGTPVVTGVTQGANGTVVINSDRTVTYTANADFTGSDSFTYTVTSGGVTETATVTVMVGANPSDITGDTSGTGTEDGGQITGQITDGDLDGLDVATPYAVTSNGTNGTATIDASGNWTYTPNADYNGSDSFVVTVTDALGNTTTQTITVTVDAEVDIADDSASTTSGQPTIIDVLGNDNFEGTPVVTGVTQGANGTVVINSDRTVTYTANADFTGSDSFTYTVTSGGVTETATVTVMVGANPSDITGDTSGTGTEDGGQITGQITDGDLDGLDVATPYAVTSNGTNGTATIDASGNWTYTPNADYNGSDSFVVTVTDALGNTTTQTITVTVDAEVDIADDSASTTSGQPTIIDVLGNDNFEGTPVVTGVTQGANGTVVINSDRTVTYTANADFTGSDSFTYTVTSGGVTETATVTVMVGANPSDITGDTSGTGTEDGGQITGQITDGDLDGLDVATPYAVTSNGTNGTATIDASGNWTYTPNADYNGSDSFVVTVTDALGNTTTQTITVTVDAEVDIADDSASTTSGQPTIIDVLGNDNFEGTPVVTGVTQGANGTVVINSDRTVTYTANADFTGSDSFTYTVTSGGVTETATVTVMVGANPSDITGDTSGTGTEDGGQITGQITDGDLDGLDVATPYAVTSNGTNGTATIDASGNWTYTPNADYNGSDSFVVTVTDALGNTTTQTITVTVDAEVDIADDSASTTSGQPTIIDVLGNDNFEGTPVVTGVTQGANGTVVINSDRTVTYTANADFTGSDSFTYTVTSGGVTETATVTVMVGANPSDITGDTSGTGTEDGGQITGQITDGDLDGLDVATPYAVTSNGTNGTATIDASGNWTYTPNADYNGSDSFVVTVTDALGNTTTQTITVTVDAEVDIADDSASTTSGQPTIIDVLGNDNFEGTPVVTGVTQGANGTVVINSDRTVTYTANADFTGSDSFTYTVTSGGVTETATVTVMVGANPSDITGDTSGTGTEDGGQITGQITDGDLDGLDVATPYAVTSNGTNGTATIDASGNWTYTPNADYNGSDSFVVTVTDALGNTTTQTITVTVDAEVDIADDSASTTSGQPTIIDVLGNDNFEGTPVVTGVTQGANGTVVINSDRTVTYTANADFTGSDSFTYTVTSGGVTETATVTVMVGANPSDITGDTSGTGTEDGGQITGQIMDGDLDGLDVATPYAVTSNGTNGTATIDASGNWTYTPNADYNGSDSFVVTVTDALGNTTTQTITVTVDAEVDIADDSASTTSGQPTIIDVLGNDNFEGTPVVTGVTQGANGTVVINSDRTVTYTANADFTGSDSFTYTVTSGGVTETATVTVMVGANPSDITGDTSGTGTEDGGQITGQITDGDLDGLDAATPYAVTSNGTNGTATIDASGNWTYTPNADYNGSDSFVVTVTDALGNTTTQTITVTVDAEVDIADDSASTTSGQPTIIDVLGNDNFEGTPVVTGVTQGANGTVVINSDRTVTYTANADFTGSDSFTYTVTSGGVTETATVTVMVGANPSDITGDTSGTGTEDGGQITGQITDGDLDGLDANPPELPVQPVPLRPPLSSTGLHILYDGSAWTDALAGMHPLLAVRPLVSRYNAVAAETGTVPRMLSPDNTLNLDDRLGQLLGTDTRQYIHDTVNHTWERVERWYGTGTPSTEMLRYDALGGAQDPFNGFTGPMESRMLEELNRLLNSILDESALTGGGESGLSPVLAESRTLQNQLSRADNLNRDIERLSRIFAEEK